MSDYGNDLGELRARLSVDGLVNIDVEKSKIRKFCVLFIQMFKDSNFSLLCSSS